MLRDAGTIAPTMLPPPTPPEQIFETFSHYLKEERGLAPKSIIRHLPVIRRFLCEVCPRGASDRGRISQESVTCYVERHARIGARGPGRRCAGRCAHFSITRSL